MDKDTRVSYYEHEPVNYFSSKNVAFPLFFGR